MNIIAVITGDIVNSSSLTKRQRETLFISLKESFEDINKNILVHSKTQFEIFRGDSFQAEIKKPELALIIGILIRAKLRSINISNTKTSELRERNFDARIAIGIGKIGYVSSKVVESDGEAFKFSGELIDKMKKKGNRLKIHTPWKEINNELEVSIAFADAIISKWSTSQAEAFYLYMLKNLTQQSLATLLNISQPSIRKRLINGKIECFDLLRNRFEKIIQSKI